MHGHRGGTGNDPCAHRQLLVRDVRRLSAEQFARLRRLFDRDDPTGEILAAWAGKQLLRQLLVDLDGTDYASHEEQGRMIRGYLA